MDTQYTHTDRGGERERGRKREKTYHACERREKVVHEREKRKDNGENLEDQARLVLLLLGLGIALGLGHPLNRLFARVSRGVRLLENF